MAGSVNNNAGSSNPTQNTKTTPKVSNDPVKDTKVAETPQGKTTQDGFEQNVPKKTEVDEKDVAKLETLEKKSETQESSTSQKKSLPEGSHEVKKGDTLWGLLAKRGFSPAEIKTRAIPEALKMNPKLNGNPDKLQVGWVLQLPTKSETPTTEKKTESKTEQKTSEQKPEVKSEETGSVKTHKVVAGDTLSKILLSQGYSLKEVKDSKIAEMARLNGLSNPDQIKVGDVLKMLPDAPKTEKKDGETAEVTGDKKPGNIKKRKKLPDGSILRRTKKPDGTVVTRKIDKDGKVVKKKTTPATTTSTKGSTSNKPVKSKADLEFEKAVAENPKKNKAALKNWLTKNGFSLGHCSIKNLPDTWRDWTSFYEVSIVGGPRKGEKSTFTVTDGAIESHTPWTK